MYISSIHCTTVANSVRSIGLFGMNIYRWILFRGVCLLTNDVCNIIIPSQNILQIANTYKYEMIIKCVKYNIFKGFFSFLAETQQKLACVWSIIVEVL